jgi:hypothetical protein
MTKGIRSLRHSVRRCSALVPQDFLRAQIFRPAAKRSCERFAAGLSRCFTRSTKTVTKTSAKRAGSTRLSALHRATTNGLVEKSYRLDFFLALFFFVLFLAVFFLAAM